MPHPWRIVLEKRGISKLKMIFSLFSFIFFLSNSMANSEISFCFLCSWQVSANDVDSGVNSLVRYSIKAGNDAYCFAIEDDTGIITVIKNLDREKVQKFYLALYLWCYLDILYIFIIVIISWELITNFKNIIAYIFQFWEDGI